jgi:hypothetical protein
VHTYKKVLVAVSFTVLLLPGYCQDSAKLSVAFYGEPYYNYDFSRPHSNTRPYFIYSHNRTNEVNINLGLIQASYNNGKIRANAGFMAGTYANANLATEPGVLKNIYEVNAGAKISKQQDVWIDAGVMPSHIGFESAIGRDCWTLTRSMAADNSPYYESGIKISNNSRDQRWYTALLLLNGWQRIQRIDGNSTVAFGTQVSFKPSDKILLNSSTFIGNDKPDTVRQMRYFHNFYGIAQLSGKLGLTVGFDAGIEQKQKGKTAMNVWYTPVIILRNQLSENKFISCRAEYYNDKNGVIISTPNNHSFSVLGLSANFDWSLAKELLWRLETKWMRSENPVFINHNGVYNTSNISTTTAFCFSF